MRTAPFRFAILGLALAAGCVGEVPNVQPPDDPPIKDDLIPAAPGTPLFGGPALDLTASTVTATPSAGLVADGDDFATVEVRLVDTEGNPIPGAQVLLTLSEGASLVTEPGATDAFGRATATFVSVIPGPIEVSATALGKQLAERPVVEFIDCLSTARRFERDVAGPVLSQCMGCHNAYGRAPEVGGSPTYAMALPGDTGFLATNQQWITDRAFLIPTPDGDLPYVIAKPLDLLADAPHGGGVVLREGDLALDNLRRFVEDTLDPQVCPDEAEVDLFETVELTDPTETYKRAVFALTGDVLDRDALDAFGGSLDDLDAAVDAIWATPGFQARLTELLNDVYLTDELNVGIRALNQMPNADYPKRFYFRPCGEFNNNCCAAGECCLDDGNSAEFCDGGKAFANEAVARGAIEVLREIVANDLPFTEILQMDQVMVNPYSAEVLGLDRSALGFDGDESNDRTEFVRASITRTADNGIPADQAHSGVLTTFSFLKRYPTTNTNVNRHRARTMYSKYLDVDVMAFLQLVIDQDEDLGEDPFRDARTCSACHAALDPIAGTFQNWKANGRYVVNGWIESLRPAGFKGQETPTDEIATAMTWLGGEIVQDPRFALATVKQVHKLLTGHAPLTLPDNPDLDSYPANLAAFLDQTAYFEEQRDLFISSGYSLKEAFKEAIQGRYFRAASWTTTDALTEEALLISGAGIGKAVTPEQMRRKLVSLTGLFWTSNNLSNGADNLLNNNRFRLLLGGIDSDEIVERFRDPFPISANVTRRMANEFGCGLASHELTWVNAADRALLRSSDKATLGDTAESANLVRDDLQAMALLFWGETLEPGDVEFEALYALWSEVRSEGAARVDAGTEAAGLTGRCRAIVDFYSRTALPAEASPGAERVEVRTDRDYTVRAWAAVFSYLMADYRFLFE
jgi:hypothetical protein